MAYSELIKHFDGVRGYMRDFFVYGFRARGEFTRGSARSYDNERRRIDGWMDGYMGFRRDASGKNVFISLSGAALVHNPLYKAFKVKSFTKNDAALHFLLMDVLAEQDARPLNEILQALDARGQAGAGKAPRDAATVRNKLREYERLGLVVCERYGRETRYRKAESRVCLAKWREAANFFSEVDPLGVIGSYVLDRMEPGRDLFAYKHHYILHALESEVLMALLEAMDAKRWAVITVCSARHEAPYARKVTPLRILVSAQNGRRYLAAFDHETDNLRMNRLDSIQRVDAGDADPAFDERRAMERAGEARAWSQLPQAGAPLEDVEMIVRAAPGEEIIARRLEREKRCGTVEAIGGGRWRFRASVRDARELFPWLRTFIGRIEALSFSNAEAASKFRADMEVLYQLYGVDG